MDFKNFIISLLKRGNINDSNIKKLTDEKAMELFQLAFTHKSYDPDNNYELVELMGDVIVNLCIIKYLRKWDPNIISVKYLTRLKHNISSKKELALMAENAGFWKHIRISKEIQEQLDNHPIEWKHKNSEYMSILEDTFEAFLGTVDYIIESHLNKDIGVIICYKIVRSFLLELNISLRYEDIFDAKTRFKELCDKRGWNFSTAMKTQIKEENDRKVYVVTVIGYPFGNKKKEKDNEFELVVTSMPFKMESQNVAAENALKILKNQYNIYDIPPDPYCRRN